MNEYIVIQGRSLGSAELEQIRGYLHEKPEWGRTRLSQEICKDWQWQTETGRLKDMACRTMLLKMEARGLIHLPARQSSGGNYNRNTTIAEVQLDTSAITGLLRDLLPLKLKMISGKGEDRDLFRYLMSKYHYLGLRNTVGENIMYLLRDNQGRGISCLLFGSAAWSTLSRDKHIGWSKEQKQQRLQWVTNNTRFLIPPWVQVKNLASHTLSLVCKRIRKDWLTKYAHPVSLLETFVDRDRFMGTCYQAANWYYTGHTTGRTRNGRYKEALRSVKDIYLYPLTEDFRDELCPLSEFAASKSLIQTNNIHIKDKKNTPHSNQIS